MHNFSIKSLCKNNNLTVLTPHPCGCSSSPVDTSPHGISCTTFYMHKTGRNIIFSFYSLFLCISLDTCVLVRAGNLGRPNVWDGYLFRSDKEKRDPSCPNG